jgi:hypothetical protein
MKWVHKLDKYMCVNPIFKLVRNKTCMIMATVIGLTNKMIILRHTGYVECEYGPDPNDSCEGCKKSNVQLYFGDRDVWDGRDGSNKCLPCLRDHYMDDMRVQFSER